MKLERPPRAIKAGGRAKEPCAHCRQRGRVRFDGVKNIKLEGCIQMLEKKIDCPMCRHVQSVFQQRRKTANILAASGVI
jgi:hypothetical protein